MKFEIIPIEFITRLIMSENTASGCLGAFMWIGTIAISIGAGILSWNWIEPHSFWGVIKFLIVWGVFSYIGHLITMGIVALFSSMLSKD